MSNRKTEVVCPLIFANRIIGGKWKMRILWHIIHGENRFGILKKCIPEISEKVLYTNLRELEEEGILHKEVVKEQKPAIVFYHLNEAYMVIKEILCAICKLAKRHADKNGEPIQEDTYQKVRYCTEGPDCV